MLLKLETDIEVVNYPVKVHEELEPVELDLAHDFNFICVAQMGPRKNLENTIKWFLQEFKDDEVGLVVKTNFAKNCQMDREVAHGRMIDLLNQVKSEIGDLKCKLYLLHGDMTDEEMHGIYLNEKVRAAVLLSHGEGFGLPAFEAAYMGIPVIATAWSGQLDFLCDEEGQSHFYDVSYDIQQIPQEVVWESVIVAESMWAYPRESSAKEQMRQCYQDLTSKDFDGSKFCDYSQQLKERFEEQKMYKQFVNAIVPHLGPSVAPPAPQKIVEID